MNLMLFQLGLIWEGFCAQRKLTLENFLFLLFFLLNNRLITLSDLDPSLNPNIFIIIKTIFQLYPTISPTSNNFLFHILSLTPVLSVPLRLVLVFGLFFGLLFSAFGFSGFFRSVLLIANFHAGFLLRISGSMVLIVLVIV